MIDQASHAHEIAAAIRNGEVSATEVMQSALERIKTNDRRYNSFTAVTDSRALAEAGAIDKARAQGLTLPPLAGVPYAVKNLFDVSGLPTLAGSKINESHAPARKDAKLVEIMHQAGAVLIGTLNMDEYAYGFTTENHHFGSTRNPHDPSRSAGGSSGGSAAAVAAGFVPLSLGSDTNGSVRVPSSMCGIFGLKPTYGCLSLQGMFPFVHSLDHAGVFARSSQDLALSFELLKSESKAHTEINGLGYLENGISGLRIATAGDYFEQGDLQAQNAVQVVAEALNATKKISLPEVAIARSAAYVITASEGGSLHQANLREQAENFDPLTRPRLLAGSLVPAAWYIKAQRFRSWFHQQVMAVFNEADILIAPATPCCAQPLGQENMIINGISMPTRPNMGMFTQPLSFIGLPIVTVPIQHLGGMPIGVQIIAAPGRESVALGVAAFLEKSGVSSAPVVTH